MHTACNDAGDFVICTMFCIGTLATVKAALHCIWRIWSVAMAHCNVLVSLEMGLQTPGHAEQCQAGSEVSSICLLTWVKPHAEAMYILPSHISCGNTSLRPGSP